MESENEPSDDIVLVGNMLCDIARAFPANSPDDLDYLEARLGEIDTPFAQKLSSVMAELGKQRANEIWQELLGLPEETPFWRSWAKRLCPWLC